MKVFKILMLHFPGVLFYKHFQLKRFLKITLCTLLFVTAAGKCVWFFCFARINKILLNIKIFNISFSIILHQVNCLLNA